MTIVPMETTWDLVTPFPKPRTGGMHEYRVSLEFVWGLAIRGVVTFTCVIAGSLLTVYTLAEGSLPTEWQMTVLPAWLGYAVLVVAMPWALFSLFLALHRLRLATAPPVTRADSRTTSIDLTLGYARLTGSPTPDQIRAAGEVSIQLATGNGRPRGERNLAPEPASISLGGLWRETDEGIGARLSGGRLAWLRNGSAVGQDSVAHRPHG